VSLESMKIFWKTVIRRMVVDVKLEEGEKDESG
jgi:hypothetical protein